MPPRPLVSIVINNFNYGAFLRQAIVSALEQDYESTEVVVVDDGSTDESRDIIAAFGHSVRAVFRANGGQAAALNSGIQSAAGELICLLDADDFFARHKVSACVETSLAAPRAILIYHALRDVDASGSPLPSRRPDRFVSGDCRELVVRSGGWWPRSPTSGLCFRRPYLDRALPIPENAFRICADGYLGELAPLIGPVIGLDEELGYYRLHGDNLWSGGETGRASRVAAIYETIVSEVNLFLDRSHVYDSRLSLDLHVPYRLALYELGLDRSPLMLAKLIAKYPGFDTLQKLRQLSGLARRAFSARPPA